MPAASPTTTAWEKTKTGSKKGFDKVWALADKLGAPVNRLSNKLGSEAFWPTTLDRESDKAARILSSFCKDGFYDEEFMPAAADGPKQKQKVLKKIPQKVIREAKGLAIFTTMRSGLWISGAGGSGVLLARKEDGTWSPPSGILLHTAGLGFLIGIDIYDCVVVINDQKALDAFSKIRCTLGGEVSAVAGPVGMGAVIESEVHENQAPIFTYLKSRGFYAGVQIDGTVIIERSDENERFYGERISVANILAGKVRHSPREIRSLMETVKAAQGDTDVIEKYLLNEPPPADMEISRPESIFGVPDIDDIDPYGVLALEKEGFEIKEITSSGVRSRPASEQFEYRPSPTSPIFSTFNRHSIDGYSKRGRDSYMRRSVDKATQMEDASTQTNFSNIVIKTKEPEEIPADIPEESELHDQEALTSFESNKFMQPPPKLISMKARLVTIPKRIPPPLPPRSPARGRIVADLHTNGSSQTDGASIYSASSYTNSPLKDGFEDISIAGGASSSPRDEENPYTNLAVVESCESVEELQPQLSIVTIQDTEASPPVMMNVGLANDETFHSVPSTPLETTAPKFEPINAIP
ncbi:MAG: hypothetical protein M1829_001839 [Trizodia sp. TS-e1964]|nr:MAG: hypothetical protein M1829_001839 [Trizodia sp. TS-e1964]